jgi:HTH-type transcriptional regulator / antitoxin HigA
MESVKSKEAREETKEIIMNPNQIIQTWQAIPVEARVEHPRSESEYEALLLLLDSVTDELAGKGEIIESSALSSLFDLASAYALEWEAMHEEPITATPREVLRQLILENQLSLKHLEREGIAKQPLLSAVLSGQREISKALALKLAKRFKTSVALFI